MKNDVIGGYLIDWGVKCMSLFAMITQIIHKKWLNECL